MSTDISRTVSTLYADHHGWLVSWLRRKLGCPHDAADFSHDTFVRVLGKSAAAPAAPRPWLATIARGLVVDHWRRQALERAWLDTSASDPAHAPSPEGRALALAALERIDDRLSSLKPRVREAFLLARLDGLAYREIGEKLGVSERMVKHYMVEAMLACLAADVD